jgi:hypothetical protein
VSGTYGANLNTFKIDISTDPAFGSVNATQTFSGTYTSGTQYDLSFTNLTPVNGTTYYARAYSAADGGTNWSPASTSGATPVWSFTYRSSGTVDWYQCKEAQFNTCSLTGASTSGNSIIISGSPTNVFGSYNPSFENSGSWSNYSTYSSINRVMPDNGSGWYTDGTHDARMYIFGGNTLTSDYALFAQSMNLTGVSQIKFDCFAYFSTQLAQVYSQYGNLHLIIGGGANDYSGSTPMPYC